MAPGEPTAARPSAAPVLFTGASAVLAVLGFVGHVLGIDLLDRIIPGRPAMQPLTAVLVVLSALGIGLRHTHDPGRVRYASSLVAGALVLGVATMLGAEYLAGWHVLSSPSLLLVAGQPSPFTAIALAALGGAILLFDARQGGKTTPREWLCLLALFVAFVSLVGHALGTGALYQVGGSRVIGVSLPTGLAVSTLALSGLLARPKVGLMRLVTMSGPAGELLRRLGLIAMIGGPLLGALVLVAIDAGGVADQALILALGAVLQVALGLVLLVAVALSLERAYAAAETGTARVQALLDHAPVGIFIADHEGRYIEVNPAGCRLLGFSRDELLGKTVADLLSEEDVQRLSHARERQLRGDVEVGSWSLRRKDGSFVATELSANMLPDGRWQAFVRDVTERLELEHKVVVSRDFLQNVLESSTEYGIIAEDLEGRIVLWNEGARLTYGYELGEIRGQSSELLVAPAERDAWAALRARACEQGTAEGIILAQRKGGAAFSAKVVCTRRHGSERRGEGLLVVSRDVTEEQRHLSEQEFLARVGVELASCLEYQETLTRVVELVTGFLGDIASIDVVGDHALRRAAVVSREPSEVAQAVRQLGATHASGHPLATVLETKQGLLLSHITSAERKRFVTSPEHGRVLDAVGATSAMLIPLVARGQLIAVLSIASCHGSRTYGPADMRLAEEVAHRAALALDNAQLLQHSRLQAAITANLAEGVALVRASDGVIVYANPRLERMFGYAPGELVGRPEHVLNAPHENSASGKGTEYLEQPSSGTWHRELESVRKDGTIFWCASSVCSYDHEEHGRVWISVRSDVTERKQLEQKNARALRDKEVLLKEIHHRVKNNLQVISSLFALQRARTSSEELKGLLDENQTRVQSIALVHQHMYGSSELASIDLDAYLRSLVGAIRSSYGAHKVQIETSAVDVELDAEQAVPCALLTTELVSNSIKHAFGEGPGKILVRAHRDDRGWCTLEVEDDGRGIPPEFDWRRSRSLGLRLVQILTHQLRGQVELDRSTGTCFRVQFPLRRAVDESVPAALPVH